MNEHLAFILICIGLILAAVCGPRTGYPGIPEDTVPAEISAAYDTLDIYESK